ncbi:hypothetical protein F4821DRAFT_241483 [Hypoxylon rubiginosum]|uniref:Uncharacterized protein n=1 Tax=Hypoxylon rubiginosum TaxID=110542 RepID=A0ACC0CX93_9PEZI|nr:hypothetical protein F4821DRAFT_241483 [Hypoxylon rubiginosum]
MSDSDDSEKPLTPSESHSEAASDASNPQDADLTETLEKARKFLRDEKVKNSSVEKVTQFLEGQGLDKDQIHKLLLEEFKQDIQNASPPPTTDESSSKIENAEPEKAVEVKEKKDTESNTSIAPSPTHDSPPIITYPEFLTTSPRPPPLITPTRLANILAVSGSIWTALYGVSRCVVNPMAETLNDSRTEYYSHVAEKLEQLVERLEDAVSEVPYKNGKPLKSSLAAIKHEEGAYADDESTFSDPTELFHRDFGTQTSPRLLPEDRPSSSSSRNTSADNKPVDAQVRRVAALRASVRELSDMHVRRAERSAELNAKLREIRDEVDKLGTPAMLDFPASYSGLGYGRTSEPDDEVKKAKDAIRSIKGMFLSTRSFPTAVVR